MGASFGFLNASARPCYTGAMSSGSGGANEEAAVAHDAPADAARCLRAFEDVTPAALAPLGFSQPDRAARILRALAGGGVPDTLYERLLPHLAQSLAACADPDQAVNNLERWAARVGGRATQFAYLADHPPALNALVTVFAASQYFANVLITQPEWAEAVSGEAAARPRAFAELLNDAARQTAVFPGPGGKRAALRQFKALQMLRIGARDLTGAGDTAVITREISDMADVVIQTAYAFCAREEAEKQNLPPDRALPPFAVIAMGKLGGQELNYSSDIDLIFVTGDEGTPAAYARGLAERIVAALSQATADGFVFRVDMRLRPEGRFGPLARSLSSCRAYYESWGEPWERQALLKARPVAGDAALGDAFVRLIQPFVWGGRDALGGTPGLLAGLRENKTRIEAKMRAAGTWRTSVKEGYGGIRDVEWAVQMLQMALGPAHPALRPLRSTNAALRALAALGVLTEEERATLTDAYWFLRAVEHRLQIRDELPVRDLPTDAAERARLARRLGFASLADFDARYRDVTEAVRAQTTRLMDRLVPPSDHAPSRDTDDDALPALLLAAGDTTRTEAARARVVSRLGARGFTDPARALDLLLISSVGTAQGAPTPGARARFLALANPLVTACARTADPDAALLGIETLAQAVPSREAFFAALAAENEGTTAGGGLLADEPSPMLSRLCLLAAGAPPLTQTLAQHMELLDLLFDPDEIERPASTEELTTRVRERLQSAKNEDARVRALGAFWRRERLRVAARTLWGEAPDAATVGEELTGVADALLDGLLHAAAARAGAEHVLPHLAVIALGKFGGRELNFPSDGDLLYVHERAEDADAASAVADALRVLMERLRREQNVDMEFDPRLRPDGRFGLLSRTPESYATYYERDAATWEKQTLLKARPAAGSPELAARWMTQARDPAVYAVPATDEQVNEMRAMKRRIETERLRAAERHTDLKLGLGALSDIEWIAQLLQCQYGASHPSVRAAATGTRNALHALHHAGLLGRGDLLTLAETYDFLQRLRNAAYLRTGLPGDTLPPPPAPGRPPNPEAERRLRALSRLVLSPQANANDAANDAAARLRAEHARRTQSVRAVFRRLFLGEKG